MARSHNAVSTVETDANKNAWQMHVQKAQTSKMEVYIL